MQPLLDRPVSFRLSAETYRKYEASAARIGMRLSQYLRFRLETEDSVSDQLSQLRLTLLDAGSRLGTPEYADPVQLELLLLARRASSSSDLRAVHLELERQGITPWAASPA